MAFNKDNFAPIGGQSARGSAPQMFSYVTTDNNATAETDGYFNVARTYLEVNDIIICINNEGLTQYKVSSVPLGGDIVIISNLTVGGVVLEDNTINILDEDSNLTIVPDNTGHVDIHSPPDSEISGVNINGVTYDAGLRVNDIGGDLPAQFVLHRHSTTLQPVVLGARANSNTDTHIAVTAGQITLSLIGAGWTGSHYDLFGLIDVAADSLGTISTTSSPGKLLLKTTKDGANIPTTALSIDSDNVMFIANTTTAPVATPTGGGYLYVEAGALKFKGSSGTVTTIANA